MLEESEEFWGRTVKKYNPRFVKLSKERRRRKLRENGFIDGLEYVVRNIEKLSIEPARVGVDIDFTVAIRVDVKEKTKSLNCAYFDKVV